MQIPPTFLCKLNRFKATQKTVTWNKTVYLTQKIASKLTPFYEIEFWSQSYKTFHWINLLTLSVSQTILLRCKKIYNNETVQLTKRVRSKFTPKMFNNKYLNSLISIKLF